MNTVNTSQSILEAPMTDEEARTYKGDEFAFGKEYADRAFRERRWRDRPATLKEDYREAAKAQRQAGYDAEY